MIFALIVFFAALFIDGATDSANSVTGAVASGALSLRQANILCALMSFLGCTVFCLFFPFVAENTATFISFPEEFAFQYITASLLSVALWSGLAWIFSLPTSEGNGLIAAGAGAAMALGGSFDIIALLKLILAIIPAVALSAVTAALFTVLFSKNHSLSLKVPIILSSAVSAFFHGSQDGQKFLALALSASVITKSNAVLPVVSAALFMGAGSLFGGRIIKKMGVEMARADTVSALSSDMGSGLTLMIFTAAGLPVSTTHIKMTSLAAATKATGGRTDVSTFILLCIAWVATFPICFGLSFFITKLIFAINL